MKRLTAVFQGPSATSLGASLHLHLVRLYGYVVLIAAALFGCSRNQEEAPPPEPPQVEQHQVRFPGTRRLQGPMEESAEPGSIHSALPIYELKMAPQALGRLEQTAFSNDTVPATFVAGGTNYEGVTVRYRGAWARSWPKKPIKIFFEKEKRFEDQRCLNLNSGWHDPGLIRECLAYHVYAACGAPAPRSRMVRLDINGKLHGIYVQVEQPDQGFLRGMSLKGAAAFKADSRSNQADERPLGTEASYRRHYEKQTAKSEGYEELQRFCEELSQTKDPVEFFNRQVDIEKYINYLAATVLVQNWDGFNKNHYLIYDRRDSRKWLVAPWDLDRTFGDHWQWSYDRVDLPILLGTRQCPGVTGWNRLQDRFLSQPQFRARFLDRLSELVETEFTPEKLFPVIDELEAEIGTEAAARDRRRWGSAGGDLHTGIAQIKRFIERRRAYVQGELKQLRLGGSRAGL